MKRTIIGAALTLALLATHADAAARAHRAGPHRAAPVGLSIGKTALPGHAKASSGHRFGAVLPTANCNPNFAPGQVPPAATWNAAIGCAFPKAGGTLQGPLGLPASTTATAPLNIPPGACPTSPSDGDICATTAGLFVRYGGATVGPLGAGGGGGSNTSFLASGNYVNVPSVTVSANQSLSTFVGPNVLLKNYGSTQIIYHAAASGATVTVATADGMIEPGGSQEIALGTNAAIAVASVVNGSISGTGSVQIIDGSGLWTGSGGGGGGSSAAAAATFTPDNSYSTPLAVTSATANTALPASAVTGSVVKIYNRGPSQVFYQLGTSGVTATAGNTPLAPNSWDSVIVKTGQTNIAAITGNAGLTATVNVESGTGLPQGTGGPANASVFQATGLTGVSWTNMGATDNAGHSQVIEATAPGTAPTLALLGIQGASNGVPVPVSFPQFTPNGNYSTPLTVGASSSRTALPSGGGSTITVYNTGANAAFVQLGNTSVAATASNDQVAAGGFLCLGVGSNVDIAAIETAGATSLNISGGSGGCAGSGGGGGGGSGGSNASVGANGSGAPTSSTLNGYKDGSGNTAQVSATTPLPVTGGILQATVTPIFSLTSATTQLLVNASGSTKVYVTAFHCAVQAGASATNGDCQLVQGTGSTCNGSTAALSPQYVWTPSSGLSLGGGLGPVFISQAGNSVCIKTTLASATAVTVGGIAALQQ